MVTNMYKHTAKVVIKILQGSAVFGPPCVILPFLLACLGLEHNHTDLSDNYVSKLRKY